MGLLLVVRHGQASWGAADYDVLSDLGGVQSRLLGEAWRTRGVRPDRVVVGGLRRHRQTAEAMGFDAPEVDEGWNEFDHELLLEQVPMPAGAEQNRDAFQTWFEVAIMRWAGGEHDDYPLSFATFAARVEAALDRACTREGVTAVVTSGGPVAVLATALLLGPATSQPTLWRALNRVCVNTGVTQVALGRRGRTLVSFNEHTHLAPARVSYR